MTTTAPEKNPWYMAGTEGTGEYKVVAVSDIGRVGYRVLAGGSVRVRVEPEQGNSSLFGSHFPSPDWKQPDGWQNRFSAVVSAAEADETIRYALRVLEESSQRVGEKVIFSPTSRISGLLRHRTAGFIVAVAVVGAAVLIIDYLRR